MPDFATIDEAMLSEGFDPNTTPTDGLSEAVQWRIANAFLQWETDESESDANW